MDEIPTDGGGELEGFNDPLMLLIEKLVPDHGSSTRGR